MSIPPLSGTELRPIRRESFAFELRQAVDHLRFANGNRYDRAAEILERIADREQAAQQPGEDTGADRERGD